MAPTLLNHSSKNGVGCFMSWNEFVNCCNQFVEVSKRLNDGWFFNKCNRTDVVGESYLMKQTVKCYSDTYSINGEEQRSLLLNSSLNDIDICDDLISCNTETISWEYHVLYSPSYGVPSLFFNAWKRDGSILPIAEINKGTSKFNSDNSACIISQQEHPVLRRPFYYVHPCDSMNILQCYKSIASSCIIDNFKAAENNYVNPLVTWLSTIAPAVQIDLPLEYAENCSLMK